MKHIKNLPELLVDSIRRALASEREQMSSLPWLTGKAGTSLLKSSITDYRGTKERSIERLNTCLDKLNISQREDYCELTEKLIDNCQFAVSRAAEMQVADVSLIAAIQQITHFNIVNYGSAASYAETLGSGDIAKILHEVMEDEKEMDNHLSHIAKETVNPSAVYALA